ncbi:MAG: hypothetical protein GC171_13835 [Terrimonas sp.]|nr:hypothetical protein [Terrimonas sp.]
MNQQDFSFIHKYFMAEKQESLLFILLGISALVLSVIFFFFIRTNPSFFKGAAIPLFVLGLLMAIVGYTVYARSDQQRMDTAYKMGLDPVGFVKNEEGPRMKTVMTNFVIIRYAEIVLLLAGLGLFIYFRTALPFLSTKALFWKGFGLTLAIMALLALSADSFAEKRGRVYEKQIRTLIKS